jgi:hypothetical protein
MVEENLLLSLRVEGCLFSILDMEVAGSFRMFVTDKIAWCYIPADSSVNDHCCEYLKSYNTTCLQVMIWGEIGGQAHIVFEYKHSISLKFTVQFVSNWCVKMKTAYSLKKLEPTLRTT